jgi:NAD(P)-dependent dehydrogenase (short-subunit alcohol dehydrogenase family)
MASKEHIILIGGAGGIGSNLARRLSRRRAKLRLVGRKEEPLRELAEEIDCAYHVGDATDPDRLGEIFEEAAEDAPITGVWNGAGSILLKPAHRTSLEDWRKTVALNLDTAFFTVQQAAKHMLDEGGAIVLMSSAAARIGLQNHEAIAAAKGGVIGLTRAAAASYASRRIRVNCVAPGLVDTPMAERIVGSEAGRKASEAMHAAGRIGSPDDVAPVIAWLLGTESTWATGQVFGIDGGLGAVRST